MILSPLEYALFSFVYVPIGESSNDKAPPASPSPTLYSSFYLPFLNPIQTNHPLFFTHHFALSDLLSL